jgi:peptidylprolyl isomerase
LKIAVVFPLNSK